MDWRHDYVEGNTRSSCSICGCSRRFPDSLTFCVDKLFRCERCMEKTAMEFDQEVAAARQRREQPDLGIGIRPPWENTDTLLQLAATRISELLPGWTPTGTFSDTYEVLPGGVGSDWSLIDFGSGTVTAPATGTVRVTVPTNTSIEFSRPSFGRSSPASNRWYGITRFAVQSTPDIKTVMRFGWAAASFVFTGVVGSLSSVFFAIGCSGGQMAVSDVEIDTATHVGEVWCRGDGYLRASIDHTRVISLPLPSLGTIEPVHYSNVVVGVGGGTSVVDIYDSVFYK